MSLDTALISSVFSIQYLELPFPEPCPTSLLLLILQLLCSSLLLSATADRMYSNGIQIYVFIWDPLKLKLLHLIACLSWISGSISNLTLFYPFWIYSYYSDHILFNSTAISHVKRQHVNQSQSHCMRFYNLSFYDILSPYFQHHHGFHHLSFICWSNIWLHHVIKKYSFLLSELYSSIIELNLVNCLPICSIISVHSLHYWPINSIYLLT